MDKKIRHERILACRYYNGEDKCPRGINEMFWDYECIWANGDNQSWNTEREELKQLGLQYFEPKDGTPDDLKYLLYNRYRHWSYMFNADEFLDWYRTQYQQPRKTNRQRRAEKRKPKLIAQCRYYKGEDENPFEGTHYQMMWYYESWWVDRLSQSYNEAEPFYQVIEHFHLEQFAQEINIPRSLLGVFMDRYIHWACIGEVNVEGFKRWILNNYLKSGKTSIQ